MSPHAPHLIAGRWEEGTESLDVVDPGNGASLGTCAWGGARAAERATDAAARAFGDWAATPARRRGDILRDAASIVDQRAEQLGALLAREAGKRLPEAVAEARISAEYFRWFAEEARRSSGRVMPAETAGRHHLSIRRPAGVALSLTPWNFPMSIQARKLAPMLAAGCTVVARVAEQAPLAVTEMIGTLVEAGLPPGVLNLVHGPAEELSPVMMAHDAVRVVRFTGSTRVGRIVMKQAADTLVRPVLELGGNAAFIVCQDADLEASVQGAVLGRLRNSGQSCVAANRILVHRSVAEEFGERLAAAFDAQSIGHGVPEAGQEAPDLGPMIDAGRVRAVSRMVREAVEGGGRLLTQRTDAPTSGAFLAPALVADPPLDSTLATQEVFGPAAGIVTFDDDGEALRRANATPLGLASYVWTTDLERSLRYLHGLDCGILGINDPMPSVVFAPMGGVNQSGIGREGGSDGLTEFQEVTYAAIGSTRR